jgi:hypothetical protein
MIVILKQRNCFYSRDFHQCQLDVKNLDFLVLLTKNWFNDPCVGVEIMEDVRMIMGLMRLKIF